MKRLLRCNTGAAIIELALVIPLLLTLLLGTVEISRVVLLHMKLDKSANSLADYVTQGTTVKTSDLLGFANTMGQILKPYSFSGSVIFSSVATNQGNTGPCNGANRTCVVWQNRPTGVDASRIGGVGSIPVLPTNFTPKNGQDVIVVEVFFNYRPLLVQMPNILTSLAQQKLYKIAIVKPRQGSLTTLQPQ
mgnify:CR=1 FL=1